MIRAVYDRKRWLPSSGTFPDGGGQAGEQAGVQAGETGQTGVQTGGSVQAGTDARDGGTWLERYVRENPKPVEKDYTGDAEWFERLAKPVTEEEEERRKRSASAVSAVGHVTNAIGALSNFLASGHGVRPLEMPEAPGGTDSFSERMRALRDRHEERRRKAALADRNAYLDALESWTEGYRRAAELDARREEAERKAENDRVRLELQAENLELRKKALEETGRKNREAERIRRLQAGGGGGQRTVRILNSRGGYDTYRADDLKDETNISKVYSGLPDRYKVRDEKDYLHAKRGGGGEMVWPLKKNPTKREMLQAIAGAIEDGGKETFSSPLVIGGQDDGIVDYDPEDDAVDYVPGKKQ